MNFSCIYCKENDLNFYKSGIPIECYELDSFENEKIRLQPKTIPHLISCKGVPELKMIPEIESISKPDHIYVYQEFSNLCRIFLLSGSTKCLGCAIFEGRKEILLLGKALKFRVILQKYGLILIKIWNIIAEIREKCKSFRNLFNLVM